jgi:hypothetical protein
MQGRPGLFGGPYSGRGKGFQCRSHHRKAVKHLIFWPFCRFPGGGTLRPQAPRAGKAGRLCVWVWLLRDSPGSSSRSCSLTCSWEAGFSRLCRPVTDPMRFFRSVPGQESRLRLKDSRTRRPPIARKTAVSRPASGRLRTWVRRLSSSRRSATMSTSRCSLACCCSSQLPHRRNSPALLPSVD